jgi:hypothetical protein
MPLWERLFQLKNREELIMTVYRQLSIDFNRAGLEIPFESTTPPQEWNFSIASYLTAQPQQSVDQLLYLIDLPEKLTMAIRMSDCYFTQLSDAILYREMVKVYYKISYSS